MSELFDEEQRDQPPARPTRRPRALVITAVVLVVAFFGVTAFANIYTDRLWFRSVDYGQVFSTLIWTRILLFVAFSVVMALAVGASIWLAYRYRPLFRPQSPEQTNLDRYRDAVTPIRTWLLLGVAAVVGAFAGASAVGQWRTFLLWRNSQPFGSDDAYFNRDIGFFVFELPWLHYLVDFVMAAAIVSLIAAAVVHYLYGGIRLQATHDRLSGAAQVQLSALLGVFVLAKGVDYYLDRFDLVNENRRLFTGMNNAAENAVLPAKNILIGVAVICALLFFVNIWRRTWQLPVVGLALLALSSILLGMIWPAIVQQFQVRPSEADKEAPYIQANIDATRAAYDLEGVETTDYSSNTVSADQFGSVLQQISTAPLVDPRLVRRTFEENQQGRAYYSVAPVLDVDRYDIDGTERALVLGVRELDQEGLNEGDRNWSNLHTVYTHGSGIIAAFANQRNAANIEQGAETEREGAAWAEGRQPGQDALTTLSGGYEERIYFGELSPEYSVVGKPSEDAPSVELGLAGSEGDDEERTTYDGEGGVGVGGFFNQFMYAVKFGEPNFILSGRVNDNSEVLYIRNPHERVEKVAPWLTVDDDAYPAVVDGRVLWILDGYTTTDRYPNSQRESFETMTDDSLQDDLGLQTLPTDEINYMRNAVKATVDAYDGTVTLYEWEEDDPILQAWKGAFPDSVVSSEEMPAELMEHLRYPEDQFKVQRYQFARYHVTEASDWYQGNDRWEVPTDPSSNGNSLQPPYRLFANPDGNTDGANTWALTTVFTPFQRENLAAFMSVNSDATSDDYGQMSVLQLANTADAPGPGIVANEFEQDTSVRDFLRDFTVGNTPPVFGNLLTLPVDDGFLYIQPVYALRQGEGAFPILQRVLVSDGDKVGIGENSSTLTASLADMLDVDAPPNATPDPGTPPDGGEGEPQEPQQPQGSLDQQITDQLERIQTAIDDAADALDAGRLADYQEANERAATLFDQLQDLIAQRDAAQGGGAAGGQDGQGDGATGGAGEESTAPSETPAPEEDASNAAG